MKVSVKLATPSGASGLVKAVGIAACVGGGLGLLLSGCSGDRPLGEVEGRDDAVAASEDDVAPRADEAGGAAGDEVGSSVLSCDDQTDPEREEYDLEVLNRELAESAEVQAATGIQTVATCADARQVRKAQDLLSAAIPVIEDESTTPGPEESSATDDDAQRVAKIYNGKQSYDVNLVWLDSLQCSGVFINGRYMLTAAHCIPNTATCKSASGCTQSNFTARVWDEDAAEFVDHDTGSGWVRMWRHEDYSGSGDTEDDIGLVKWMNSTDFSGRGQRIHDDSLSAEAPDNLSWIKGWGVSDDFASDAGVLRTPRQYWHFELTSIATKQLMTEASNNARVCSGDSGTRVEVYAGIYQTIGAVHSNSTKPSSCTNTDNCCAAVGTNQKHCRVRAKMDWIEARIGTTCTRYSSAGENYRRCW